MPGLDLLKRCWSRKRNVQIKGLQHLVARFFFLGFQRQQSRFPGHGGNAWVGRDYLGMQGYLAKPIQLVAQILLSVQES